MEQRGQEQDAINAANEPVLRLDSPPSDAHARFVHYFVTKLQAFVRAFICKRRLKRSRAAAIRLQRTWRKYIRWKRQKPSIEDESARIIQRCFISVHNRTIFRRIMRDAKQLQHMDPAYFLRNVDQTEHSLSQDVGNMLHVRIRLYGTHFPPSMCYKVFTHGRVQDVNSECPHDFTALRGFAGGGGSYRRTDNNCWKALDGSVASEIVLGSKAALQRYRLSGVKLHSSATRAQRAAQRKQKRREWLAKLYTGQLPDLTGSVDGHTEPASKKAHSCTDSIHEEDNVDVLDQDEEQSLLNFAAALDWDAYEDSWLRLASSLGSEAAAIPINFSDVPAA